MREEQKDKEGEEELRGEDQKRDYRRGMHYGGEEERSPFTSRCPGSSLAENLVWLSFETLFPLSTLLQICRATGGSCN